jgi:Lon protease-like protein
MSGFYAVARSESSKGVQSTKFPGSSAAAGDFVDSLLPLFPLDVVLFPGTPLPLHIFEPRYKEMIGECLAHDKPFGMVRSFDKGMADVGCTAEIVTVVKQYPDGRLDIVTQGRERFKILNLNQEMSFLRAEVIAFDDEAAPDDTVLNESGAPLAEETARAVALHAEILGLAGAVQDLSGAHRPTLSFYLAGSLPLDLDLKQKLLELRSEPTRISALTLFFENLLPNLRRAANARAKAGGNGHAR